MLDSNLMVLQWRQPEAHGHMWQWAILLARRDPALSAAAVPGWAEVQLSGIIDRYHLIKHRSCADLTGRCILCSSQGLRCVQE